VDGAVLSLCLDPAHLQEGVAASAAATAWFVQLAAQHQAPLLAGHTAAVTVLVPGPHGAPLLASLAQDGHLALWQTSSSSNSTRVPLAEWCSTEAPLTAAALLPEGRGVAAGRAACVLVGQADGRVALLELPLIQSAAGGSRSTAGSGGSGGVMRWCVGRHPSPVISLSLHPTQPLVMAASRCASTPLRCQSSPAGGVR
jgi:hypothetical protein